MAWTTPKTDWSTGELVTAADLNTMNENLAVLRQPPTAVYTTTAESTVNIRDFAYIDNANLNLTIATTGRDVMVHFHGSITLWDNGALFLDIEVDGSRLGGVDGTLKHFLINSDGNRQASNLVSFTRVIQNLNAGSHTFKLQWKGSKEQTLNAGAQFWVREI